eukprot:944113-Pleurochrysis_carterae.AAC.1
MCNLVVKNSELNCSGDVFNLAISAGLVPNVTRALELELQEGRARQLVVDALAGGLDKMGSSKSVPEAKF